ncbi:dual OB domain-containing protein [Streptococcus orisratti]|uniref:dual OB domain-containing protein n=1 Tax=Streptococcus orisratti TaxID=114652 RepID=UPI003D0134F8
MRLVILTKSDMHNGYCIAGRDIESGRWVRLKNNRGVMDDTNLMTRNGYECKELDVIEVELLEETTRIEHQPENVLIDQRYHLEKTGTMSWQEVIDKWGIDNGRDLLGFSNGYYVTTVSKRSEYFYHNNIENRSLAMIDVDEVSIDYGVVGNHPKIKFNFRNSFGETTEYYFRLTDPDFKNPRNGRPQNYDRAYLIVSLSEKYDGEKICLLAAKLIPIE